MAENIENQVPVVNAELPTQTPDCGAGCACHATEPSSRIRWIIGAVILVVVAVLVVRAVAKTNGASVSASTNGFAAFPTATQTPEPSMKVGNEINTFADLNTSAADTNAVFVFLPDKNSQSKPPTTQIQSAVQTLNAKGIKVGLFTLRADSSDYNQMTAQISAPAVIVAVKGGGMSAVSGEVTETKLIQAFVSALNAGGGCGTGCAPSTPGCK